jgi:uncharacterized protein (DUF2141 family)
MKTFISALMALLAMVPAGAAQQTAHPAPAQASPVPAYTLTVIVDGVNEKGGNIGVLVFNSDKGRAEDRFAALRDVVVPAHPGSVTVSIPNLPAGDYALAIAHDVNQNHKVDKFLGVPKEQWGMSNDPHATVKAPAFAKARFPLKGNQEIHVKMQ